MKAIAALLCPVLCLLALPSAQAANWQVCRLEVEISGIRTQPYPGLRARVLQTRAQPANAECPPPGQLIEFEPESPDYQSMVPRKQWPKPGQRIRMRYQYLDGTCKNDGNPKPCRIRHYPLGW
ncbi:hypothetical protein J2T41_001207 [Pseudomonas citronellolis]|uniref:hypothetical protein n=1 Tax=Pseudomonas citronellolis TaxID=53408 RepID=UPI00209C9BF8|nr:hypothetical protein [Pseudomonas citronellolis]MCP1664529.1 hypothetical protein [Pseudomonas citronellolis]MCP1695503.1 hypothetical protein [Pseudomonas citronellolis]MCP1702364.1 hypothetical protein [Pseudomonas citronellolis]MCP1796250.1 hypothetical protein [Pseudomonas citronellolis]